MNPKKILSITTLLLVGGVLALISGLNPLAAAVGIAFLGGAQQLPVNCLGVVSSIGDVAWGDGDDNMGGIRTQAYFCLHSDVRSDGHQAPATRAAATSLSMLSTISLDLGFKTGKGWKKCYTTEDKAFVESVMQGERDGKSWLTKIQLHFPGNGARIVGLMRLIQNAGCYVLGYDAEGKGRLVGSEHYPAKMDASTITTTETAAGLKGVTFSLMASSPYPAPICTFEPELEESESE
jgi:hypothetical protein